MVHFGREELDLVDALWRQRPADHVWTGWAAASERPEEIWIFRTRAHWRRFSLRKTSEGYALFDEKNRRVAEASSLGALLQRVEAIPGLQTAQGGS